MIPVRGTQHPAPPGPTASGRERPRARARTVEQLKAALESIQRRLDLLFEATPAALGVSIGNSGVFEFVNQALCDLVGYRRDELIGRSAAAIMHPDDAPNADAQGAAAVAAPNRRFTGRTRLVHKSGRTVVVDMTLTWIEDGDTSMMFVQLVDVSRYMAEAEELRVRSETDALTGLANRVHLMRVLERMHATGAACAILFVDLDGFKPVNDSRGHAAGDELLVEVAASLSASARHGDLVARVGGDEFVIVCRPDVTCQHAFQPLAAAARVADAIEGSLAAPLAISSGPVPLTASIGISDGTVGHPSPTTMLEQADAAMYAAKRSRRRRYVVYDAKLESRIADRRGWMPADRSPGGAPPARGEDPIGR